MQFSLSLVLRAIRFQMLLHLLETHETNVQKLVLRGNTISRCLLKNIQELLHQKTRYCKSDQEQDSCSSSKDSSESEGDYELHEKNPLREIEDDQDDAKSSTTALHNFTIERGKMNKKDQLEPEANDTQNKGVKSHPGPHSHNTSDSGELGSDENDSIDEEDKNGLSEEGSHLKTMDDYFSRDQTVYSNLYIQAQQRDDENPPSHDDKVKTINDAMFARVMRVSKDGYG